jgi:ApbE superfamily uncharacterized protein (UPF0280 family)
MTQRHQERTYRNRINPGALATFRVVVKETDLLIHADTMLEAEARELVLESRGYLEAYIEVNPAFGSTLAPWRVEGPAPKIVRAMAEAGRQAGVGPMAAVAGAIAEAVGNGLTRSSKNLVIENGGDIYLRTEKPVTVGIYAGSSPLSMKIGLRLDPEGKAMGVCTSSATVGHSLSLGCADAVCVVSRSCSLADAAATAIGNHVESRSDAQRAIDFGRSIAGIDGIVIVVGKEIGLWGQLELVPVGEKRP